MESATDAKTPPVEQADAQAPEDPIARKKRLQHEAYRRWYTGPKGLAFKEKKRKKPLAERQAEEVK